MATTTSTQNSGLLEQLLPVFKNRTGIKVDVIAVGTGKALKMGRDGDVDVVLVHAEKAERRFVAEGHGVGRRQVMYNDFVLVGPAADPAHIRTARSAPGALEQILHAQSRFVSRGDDSGTHKKELDLWRQTTIRASGKNYLEAGQGMGRVLQMASELEAYTLTDRGTWLALKDRLDLALLFEGDSRLNNPYGIIAVNPEKYADIHYPEAMQLIEWISGVEGQNLIDSYRLSGKRLFIPLRLND